MLSWPKASLRMPSIRCFVSTGRLMSFAYQDAALQVLQRFTVSHQCILNAIVVHRQPCYMELRALVAIVERHKHDISSVENSIHSTDLDRYGVEARGVELDQLPIGLKYALDSKCFREAKEMEYFQAIGLTFGCTGSACTSQACVTPLVRRLERRAGLSPPATLQSKRCLGKGAISSENYPQHNHTPETYGKSRFSASTHPRR